MKLTITLCSIILAITLGYYYKELNKRDAFKVKTQYGSVVWPIGSYYEFNADGDIKIELSDSLKVLRGEWESGTQFEYIADELVKIITPDEFTFSDLKFDHQQIINVSKDGEVILHNITLASPMTFDGLDLQKGCQVFFKMNVLHSAKCPSYEDKVHFKRFIKLPEEQKQN